MFSFWNMSSAFRGLEIYALKPLTWASFPSSPFHRDRHLSLQPPPTGSRKKKKKRLLYQLPLTVILISSGCPLQIKLWSCGKSASVIRGQKATIWKMRRAGCGILPPSQPCGWAQRLVFHRLSVSLATRVRGRGGEVWPCACCCYRLPFSGVREGGQAETPPTWVSGGRWRSRTGTKLWWL